MCSISDYSRDKHSIRKKIRVENVHVLRIVRWACKTDRILSCKLDRTSVRLTRAYPLDELEHECIVSLKCTYIDTHRGVA